MKKRLFCTLIVVLYCCSLSVFGQEENILFKSDDEKEAEKTETRDVSLKPSRNEPIIHWKQGFLKDFKWGMNRKDAGKILTKLGCRLQERYTNEVLGTRIKPTEETWRISGTLRYPDLPVDEIEMIFDIQKDALVFIHFSSARYDHDLFWKIRESFPTGGDEETWIDYSVLRSKKHKDSGVEQAKCRKIIWYGTNNTYAECRTGYTDFYRRKRSDTIRKTSSVILKDWTTRIFHGKNEADDAEAFFRYWRNKYANSKNEYEIKEVDCPECKGKGKTWIKPQKITCPKCKGSTWIPDRYGGEYRCKQCNRTGKIEKEGHYVKCSACSGKGKVEKRIKKEIQREIDCPECKGKGKTWIEARKEKCRSCNGKGYWSRNFKCMHCEGKKFVEIKGHWKKCQACEGKGKVKN